MKITLRSEHELGKIEVLTYWSNELFPVYSPDDEDVLDIGECGVDLFGIVSFGVHLTAYVQTKEGTRHWVAKRSRLISQRYALECIENMIFS